MAKLLQTPHSLSEGIIPLEGYGIGLVKRVFWMYENSPETVRGKHRHKMSTHLLICLAGSCKVYVNNGQREELFQLKHPSQTLYLAPEDWREMFDFSKDCRLFCFSNQHYDPNDYIYIPYPFTDNPMALKAPEKITI